MQALFIPINARCTYLLGAKQEMALNNANERIFTQGRHYNYLNLKVPVEIYEVCKKRKQKENKRQKYHGYEKRNDEGSTSYVKLTRN